MTDLEVLDNLLTLIDKREKLSKIYEYAKKNSISDYNGQYVDGRQYGDKIKEIDTEIVKWTNIITLPKQ